MATQLQYDIMISIPSEGEVVTDIQYCSFIRAPLQKQSSFCMVRAYMPQVLLRDLIIGISANIFVDMNIKIWASDEGKATELDERKTKLIYDRGMICVGVRPDGGLRFNNPKTHAELILVHPVLHYMSTTNVYNDVLENTTANGALESFEGFISSKYGDIFQFNKIGADVNQNSFEYETMLIKATNDINIPTYIQSTYKITNSFAFYFFDNFYISDDAEKEIVCHFIGLYDETQFEQIDVDQYADGSLLTKIIGERPFYDLLKTLDKKGHTFIHNWREIIYSHKKTPPVTSIIKKEPGGAEDIELIEKRNIKTPKNGSQSTTTLGQSATYSRCYVPDEYDLAEERFDLNQEIVKDKISRLVIIESMNSLPDFPQFGYIYNMDPLNESEYLYTPLNIINTFIRKNNTEDILQHCTRCLMLKYKSQE